MSEHELSMDELVAQEAMELPAREMMQLLIINRSNFANVCVRSTAVAVNTGAGGMATAISAPTVIVAQNSGDITLP